jgi:hypothetical protein
VFPWNVAIRPEKEWNFRDWFSATRFSTFQRRGRVLGTLALARRTVAHLRKQLWRALQKRSA